MGQATKLILLIIGIVLVITWLLMKKFKGKKYNKYIPTFAIWFTSFIFFINGTFYADPGDDLIFWNLSIIAGLGTIVAMIITIITAKRNNK